MGFELRKGLVNCRNDGVDDNDSDWEDDGDEQVKSVLPGPRWAVGVVVDKDKNWFWYAVAMSVPIGVLLI